MCRITLEEKYMEISTARGKLRVGFGAMEKVDAKAMEDQRYVYPRQRGNCNEETNRGKQQED